MTLLTLHSRYVGSGGFIFFATALFYALTTYFELGLEVGVVSPEKRVRFTFLWTLA